MEKTNLVICFLDPLANIWLLVEERKRFDNFADKSPDGHCNGYNVLFLSPCERSIASKEV